MRSSRADTSLRISASAGVPEKDANAESCRRSACSTDDHLTGSASSSVLIPGRLEDAICATRRSTAERYSCSPAASPPTSRSISLRRCMRDATPVGLSAALATASVSCLTTASRASERNLVSAALRSPASMNPRASAAPMPDVAPVTSTRRPANHCDAQALETGSDTADRDLCESVTAASRNGGAGRTARRGQGSQRAGVLSANKSIHVVAA